MFLPDKRCKDYISQPLLVTLHETAPLERLNAAELADACPCPLGDEHFISEPAIAREYLVLDIASELGGHGYPEMGDTSRAKLTYYTSIYIKAPVPEVPAGTFMQVPHLFTKACSGYEKSHSSAAMS